MSAFKMTTCQICKKEFTKRGLTYHITHIHRITKKDYYDTYLKTPKNSSYNNKLKPELDEYKKSFFQYSSILSELIYKNKNNF